MRQQHRAEDRGNRGQQQRHHAGTVVLADQRQRLGRRTGREVDDHVAVGDRTQVRQQVGEHHPAGKRQQPRPERGLRLWAKRIRHGPPCPPQPRARHGRTQQARAAVGDHHAPGVAPPVHQQPDAQHCKRQAVAELHRGDQADVPQRRVEAQQVVVADHRQQTAGQQGDQPQFFGRAEDQLRERLRGKADAHHRQCGQRGTARGGAPQERAELAPLAEVFDVAPEGARQREHRQRRGQHQEAPGHVPQPEVLGIEPAAEEDRAHEARHALHAAEDQQHQHAGGQRIGAQPGAEGLESSPPARGGRRRNLRHRRGTSLNYSSRPAECKRRPTGTSAPTVTVGASRTKRLPMWRQVANLPHECEGAAVQLPPQRVTILSERHEGPHRSVSTRRCDRATDAIRSSLRPSFPSSR